MNDKDKQKQDLTQIEEDLDQIVPVLKVNIYGAVQKPCPLCGGMTLVEDTFEYQKVVSCTNCDFYEERTLRQ